jgi:hypothetical protein
MFSLKPGGIWTRVFCFWGGCNVHSFTSLEQVESIFRKSTCTEKARIEENNLGGEKEENEWLSSSFVPDRRRNEKRLSWNGMITKTFSTFFGAKLVLLSFKYWVWVRIQKPDVTYHVASYCRKAVCQNLFAVLSNVFAALSNVFYII